MQDLICFFNENDIEFHTGVTLSGLSTFKIGGNADLVCLPKNTEQVSELVKFCTENKIRYMTFGRCSNVLFPDEGLRTLLIKTDRLDSIGKNAEMFEFGAGVMLAKAAAYTIENGNTGMEPLYGIPGSVGGAVYMNAGAYGGEMSQIVFKSEYVDDRGEIKILEKSDHRFGYRHSFFSDNNCIITKTYVALEKGDKTASLLRVKELQEQRRTKQPLDMPSAGSVFKRPSGYYAGALIENCGLKGVSVGGAQVSVKHAGFIVNKGNATANDVKALISVIQKKVESSCGVNLECELRFVGD